jgi:hypothetical protein
VTSKFPGRVPAPLAQRVETFWAMTTPEPNTGCWLWTGSVNQKGYGKFWWDRRDTRAHRVSWELANSARVPPGLLVLHGCDVPACVNPAHLRVGTPSDNNNDAAKRGRARTGGALQRICLPLVATTVPPRNAAKVAAQRKTWAKVTPEQVREIRRLARMGTIPYGEIAGRFGIKRPTVSMIALGRNWRDIPD